MESIYSWAWVDGFHLLIIYSPNHEDPWRTCATARETTSRGRCGLGCPSRNERGGEGDCVKEGGGGEGERERECALGLLLCHNHRHWGWSSTPLLWLQRVRLCSSATGRTQRAWTETSPSGWIAMTFQRQWSALRSPASGNPTLGMLVEMLVERVFLVGGVVKTVFPLIKKKRFFLFFTTNKRK